MGAKVEKDPRSSDFGKIQIGNTRLDPLAGLAQVTTFLKRLQSGKLKTTDGSLKPARSGETTWNFIRSKFTPILGAAFDTRDILVGQKPPAGHPQILAKTSKNFPYVEGVIPQLVVPLGFRDVQEVMQEQGVPKGLAIELLNLFGWGMQHYGK